MPRWPLLNSAIAHRQAIKLAPVKTVAVQRISFTSRLSMNRMSTIPRRGRKTIMLRTGICIY